MNKHSVYSFVLAMGIALMAMPLPSGAKAQQRVPQAATTIESELNVVGQSTVTVEQTPRSTYASDKVALKVNDMLAALGVGSSELAEALPQVLYATQYNSGAIEDGGGMKRAELTNQSTATAPGYWLRAVQDAEGIETGECAAAGHGQDDRFFVESFVLSNDTLYCHLGQYPGALKSDQHWFANLYILWGDKAWRLVYHLDVVAPEHGNGLAGYTKVGSATVTVEQEPDDSYTATTIKPDVNAIAALLGCQASAMGLAALDDYDNFGQATANNGGYWFTDFGTVTAYGPTAALFVEPTYAGDYSSLRVGQYPKHFNIGDEAEAHLYFMSGQNYYEYTVRLRIIEAKPGGQNFTNVATRAFILQTTVHSDHETDCDQQMYLPLGEIEDLLGTDSPMLYGLATDEVAATSGTYTKKYTCTPHPGFWLDKDGRVVSYGGSACVGLTYWIGQDQQENLYGVFSIYQYPNRNKVGDVRHLQLFLVNEDNGKMLTFDLRIRFVNSLTDEYAVGYGELGIPVASEERTVDLDLTECCDLLGVTEDELLNPDSYCLRGMTADGIYGEASSCANGLAFDLDGGYNDYGDIFFTIERQEGKVVLVVSGQDVDDDYEADAQFCFQVGGAQYSFFVTFMSDKLYGELIQGIDLVNSEKGIVNSDVYDLQGRRVNQPAKGFYIVSGRKVVW